MGFGRKRNVCNQEKSAHTVVWEKDEDMAALKVQVADLQALALVDPARKAAAEDAARMEARNRKEKEEAKDADMATLKALVAEMQKVAAATAATAVAKAEAEAAADCTRWSKCLFPAASKEVEAGQVPAAAPQSSPSKVHAQQKFLQNAALAEEQSRSTPATDATIATVTEAAVQRMELQDEQGEGGNTSVP